MQRTARGVDNTSISLHIYVTSSNSCLTIRLIYIYIQNPAQYLHDKRSQRPTTSLSEAMIGCENTVNGYVDQPISCSEITTASLSIAKLCDNMWITSVSLIPSCKTPFISGRANHIAYGNFSKSWIQITVAFRHPHCLQLRCSSTRTKTHQTSQPEFVPLPEKNTNSNKTESAVERVGTRRSFLFEVHRSAVGKPKSMNTESRFFESQYIRMSFS